MLSRWLPFEKEIVQVEEQLDELKALAARERLDMSKDIERLERLHRTIMERIFQDLSPWDKVQLARHPRRPYSLDYISALCSEWYELHGDRAFGDDPAIVAGLGIFQKRAIGVVGNQKGRDIKERQLRNFGSPAPEGLRKAGRVMELAARFGRPILSFVDTPGAACSPDAEERGISEAIAASQMLMSRLPAPIVVVITGEGCSGGAIATALGDRVLMLEHSYYSVISPEGCASILYRDPAKAPEAAVSLKITAEDALGLGVVEEIVPEPLGGAHRDFPQICRTLGATIQRHFNELCQLPTEQLLEERYARFRRLGQLEDKLADVHSPAEQYSCNGAPQDATLDGVQTITEKDSVNATL